MSSEISVVMNTLNEERTLPYALRSVRPWVHEIVVVDMHSEDSTARIAASYGARVVLHSRIGFADPARPFALAQATRPWVLMLDADELVPTQLSQFLLDVASRDLADVVNIPWLNMLLGQALAHTGWGPTQDRHPRFFKRGSVILSPTVHNFIRPAPEARTLDVPWDKRMLGVVHFNYRSVSHFISKLDNYTTVEADQATLADKKKGSFATTCRALATLVRRLIWLRGYRDGWRGYFLSFAMAFYKIAAWAKAQETREHLGDNAAAERYRQIAEQILSGYTNPPDAKAAGQTDADDSADPAPPQSNKP